MDLPCVGKKYLCKNDLIDMAIQPENSRVTPTEHEFNIKSVLQKSYLKGEA